MRALFGAARWLTGIAIALGGSSALAETITFQNSSQFGMNLPQASLPNGQDEIRTSDGASCRSSVGGNGAYFDMGLIGAPENGEVNASGAAYGRIVVPQGRQAKRLDCTTLYALEIERLKMELQIAKMGIGGKGSSAEASLDEPWANEGWSNEGKQTSKAKGKTVAAESAEVPEIEAEAATDEMLGAEPEVPVKGKKKAVQQLAKSEVMTPLAAPEPELMESLY